MRMESARSVEDHFEKLEQIGEGTYGQVRAPRKMLEFIVEFLPKTHVIRCTWLGATSQVRSSR